MNTPVTIPWEAVVQGCPPSPKAKALPLVVSKHLQRRAGSLQRCAKLVVGQVIEDMRDPMAMLRTSCASSLVELPLPAIDCVAMLTSDNESRVVIQAFERPLAPRLQWNVSRDAFARRYVARYARLDADVPGFVASSEGRAGEDEPRFLNPHRWGFTRSAGAWHWTGDGLFRNAGSHSRHSSLVSRPRYHDLPPEPAPARSDVFKCLPELEQASFVCEALGTIDAPPKWDRNACYHLAVSLGRCRVLAIDPPNGEDFTLTPAAFHRAAEFAVDHVRAAIKRTADLAINPSAVSPYLDRNVALNLIEMRIDVWIALVALDEAYAAALYDAAPEVPAMSRRLTQVRRLINLFDGNLQKNLPLLRLAASTYLLDNWRRLLAPPHRDCPPWWLDGCIG